VALQLFNDSDAPIALKDIKSALNVDDDVVKRVMHSLACGKYQLLLKSPASRGVSSTDTFAFNGAFSCPMVQIRLPMASLSEAATEKKVATDRSHAIEAAVVRIMKSRKTLTHAELVGEVIKQLSFFTPDPSVVKRRIEHLIEREYLERDEEDSSKYVYLA
jgi:cullin 1